MLLTEAQYTMVHVSSALQYTYIQYTRYRIGLGISNYVSNGNAVSHKGILNI